MAKSQKAMKGWEYRLGLHDPPKASNSDNPPDTPRKSRRTAAGATSSADQLILIRQLDNLEIKQGDCILVDASLGEEDDHLPELALIKEINFGTDNFIDIKINWFYRINEVDTLKLPKFETLEEQDKSSEENEIPYGYHPNDIFLSPVVEKVMLGEIINKFKVISQKAFDSIVIDESNSDSTYICRRFSNSDGEYFTDIIDWDEIVQLAITDGDALYHMLKNTTVEPVYYNLEKSRSATPVMTPKKTLKKQINYAEVDDESDDYSSSEEEDSDATGLSESDEEEPGISTKKRAKNKGNHNRQRTKRRKKDSKPSDKKSIKRSLKESGRMKSPHKPSSSLPTIKRRLKLTEQDNTNDDLNIDGEEIQEGKTNRVFRKAKKKLHTSSRLHSLPCREEEFHQIFYNLENAIQTQTGCCIYVSGTPGVGKTATIREVIRQLSATLSQENNGESMFNYCEINGLKLISPQVAYLNLWEKISGKRHTSTNSMTLLEEYFTKFDKKRKPMVVLLDELDQIVSKNQSVMYNFFNWPSYTTSKLIVIAVANTMDLPERMLTNKISSRLGLTRIQFPGYTFDQLAEIIKHRLEKLSRVNEGRLVISKDAILFASRKVASVSGDARRSLMICVRALEIAEMEFMAKSQEVKDKLDGKYAVTIMHIMKAVNETTTSHIANYLNSLSFVAKMILASMMLRKKRTGLAELQLGEVIDELNNQFHLLMFTELSKSLNPEHIELLEVVYGIQKGDKNVSRLRVNGLTYILKDLEESGIIIQQQTKAERMKMLRLNISDDEILSCFKNDSLMKDIVIET